MHVWRTRVMDEQTQVYFLWVATVAVTATVGAWFYFKCMGM